MDEFEHGQCHAQLDRLLSEHLAADHTALDHTHPHAHQAGEDIAEALHALAEAEIAAASEAESAEVAEVQAEAAVVAEEAAQEIELEEATMPEAEEAPARVHPLYSRIGGAA